MTDLDLQAEGLTVLPLRLETMTIDGPKCAVDQGSFIRQHRAHNHAGGDGMLVSCDETSTQTNTGVDPGNMTQTRVGDSGSLAVIQENKSRC